MDVAMVASVIDPCHGRRYAPVSRAVVRDWVDERTRVVSARSDTT